MTSHDSWFTHVRRVAWVDTDPSGAYQFTAALRYAEEAEIAMLRDQGILELLYPHLPRISVGANFHRPCVFEELIHVRIRVIRCGTSSISYEFRLEQADGALCADGQMSAVFVDDRGRPAPVPPIARQALTPCRDRSR
jgi:acyl-CoA thioesterase FadM